jgi:Family of unknown function (DUF7033)
MKKRLTHHQIEYVLEHLAHHAKISPELRKLFLFGTAPKPGNLQVYFPLSEEDLDPTQVIRIDGIPVLYPVDRSITAFYTIENKNLLFRHDLLKSAFHLLSGYEEYKSGASDKLGRFPYKASLQYRLEIVSKPVVNYYFEAILQGLEEFCRQQDFPFQRTPLLSQAVFALSHDIDMINAYHFFETAYKFKMLLKLVPSPYTRRDTWRIAFSSLYHFLNPFSRKNPFWNFDFLIKSEVDRGFRSSFYFLEKDGTHDNSRYHFHTKKIRELINRLSKKGFEVGIHGTIQSATDQGSMDRTVAKLRKAAPGKVEGIRQHYLKYSLPLTAQIQQKADLTYDATLGFAEHEGFRNSYCWPFKLYDFKNDQALDLWQIPLTMMDVTMFGYRKMNFEGIHLSIEELVEEVQKFKGVFSLLWHNSFFDEYEHPGVTSFYLDQLDYIHSMQLEGITGRELVGRMSFAN